MTFTDIAIVGAGALGSYYGARLARHGCRVHFLLRADYDAVRAHGLVVKSRDGDFALRPDQFHAYDDPARMPQCDLALVTLKTTANDALPRLVGPVVGERTIILTLQNGLGAEERLAELFGGDRVLGGLAFVCIHRERPGEIHHTDHGLIKVGEFARAGVTDRLRAVADLFNAARINTEPIASLAHGRWEKLVWNVPFNGLGAALDLATDALLASPAGRRLVGDVMREVVAAAAAVGVTLPPTVVDFQIDRTASMGAYRTSMQIDRNEGRPMEVEAIVGHPLRAGTRAGVAMPLVSAVYQMLTTVDAASGSRAPDRD